MHEEHIVGERFFIVYTGSPHKTQESDDGPWLDPATSSAILILGTCLVVLQLEFTLWMTNLERDDGYRVD